MNTKNVIIVLSALASIVNVEAKSFEKAIQQKQWKVKVSHQALEGMHKASTLLISCVDFRLRDEAERFMRVKLGLLDDYDEIAIPGAALALTAEGFPHWNQTVEDIIRLLKDLHHIKRIIFLDHRECGAYKKVLGADTVDSRDKETATHQKVFATARKRIHKSFPDLKVYTLIMGLDGIVEKFD